MAEDKKENKKSSKLMLIIGGVIVLIIISLAVFFVTKTMLSSENASKEEVVKLGPVYETSEYTVNILGTDGRRFLRTQFTIEFDSEDVLEEVQKKLPIVNDTVIFVLSSQTLEELERVNGKEALKEQLKDNLNEIINGGEVVNIYFNTFVWQ